MNILGRKVVIRAIEEADLPLLHKWANDPEIWHTLGGWHFPSSFEYQKKWFGSIANDQHNQRFAVQTDDLGLIGTVNLVDIDWKNNHAFTGLQLGDKDIRGKGYGVDIFMAIARYAFEELHLERLDGTVIEYNQIAYNMITRKCGWKEEGRRRNWYFRNNRYWDRIEVGLTREDYFELISVNKYWENDKS